MLSNCYHFNDYGHNYDCMIINMAISDYNYKYDYNYDYK
jgi:hypothetical protein